MDQLLRSLVRILRESEGGLNGLEIVQRFREEGEAVGIDIVICLDQALVTRVIDVEYTGGANLKYKSGPRASLFSDQGILVNKGA
ncbi:MAG TPA: hypothetical protein DCK76_02220 [Desulfotomaculum sp.]|nr:MAG: hypothetical protein XD84_1544 [Desulfotomaculum sp. 46_80]HAG10214.1 hypothetical protein [Desulfotomaculum sp.]HBY04262.1 hypothetical protein [Desulfotomaculum sp.]